MQPTLPMHVFGNALISPSLDELISLPPQPDKIFKLKKEDIGLFENGLSELFGKNNFNALLIDHFRYDSHRKIWTFPESKPRTYKGLREQEEDIISLDFKIGDMTTYYLLRLNRRPKFAFLEDKNNPREIKALYLSQGFYDSNPWIHRMEDIYVVRK